MSRPKSKNIVQKTKRNKKKPGKKFSMKIQQAINKTKKGTRERS